MQPTDVANVVERASDAGWTAGLVAFLLLALLGVVLFHYREMWSYIRRMSIENQDVVDDNTLAWLQVARVFGTMPCLVDSDVDEMLSKAGVKPEDFKPNEEIIRRILHRREKRQELKDK